MFKDSKKVSEEESSADFTGYRKQYNQAVADKTARSLTAKFVEWKDVDQQIVGKLLAKNIVKGSVGGVPYNQYLFDTDEGLVKCALGSATDAEAGQLMQIGGIYSITFGGQEKLKGGHKINRFEVLELGEVSEGSVDGGSDVPF